MDARERPDRSRPDMGGRKDENRALKTKDELERFESEGGTTAGRSESMRDTPGLKGDPDRRGEDRGRDIDRKAPDDPFDAEPPRVEELGIRGEEDWED